MYSRVKKILRNVVGLDYVLSGEMAAPYCVDWRGRYSGDALAVVLPGDKQQVAAVVAACAGHGLAIVPQGGNTSLCGGAVPLPHSQQIVVNLSRMNRIHALDTVNYTLTAEAGCSLAAIRKAAEQANRLFPLGLSAIAEYCEIGGNISTNAGGVGVLRYGNMRDLVLGLEVVLPDGRIWDGLRRLRKDNTGYDLKQLFIGAEGTLGIITAAVLKLFPRPRSVASACVAVRDPSVAVGLLAYLRENCGDKISAFEIISSSCIDLVLHYISNAHEPLSRRHDWIVLIELSDVLPVSLDLSLNYALQGFAEGILEFSVDSNERAASWWYLRKNISEAQKIEGFSVKHDVAVPLSHVAEFLTQANSALCAVFNGVRIVAFGHIGDGNIHYNVSMPDTAQNSVLIEKSQQVNRIVYDIVNGLGGSISAEHGLGQLKRNEICQYKDAIEMGLMRSIKFTIDPENLMNPGKVI